MLVDFNTLSEDSRMWIYQADRKLNDGEIENLKSELESFIKGWQAHGKDLTAGFHIVYNRFLILAVDETIHQATGCSIDSSVAVLNKIQDSLGVDFFNRALVVYSSNDQLHQLSLAQFKTDVKSGQIPGNALIFNNTIVRKGDMDNKWIQPIEKSWAARLMPSATV